MTLAEIQLVIKSYADRKEMEIKETITHNYNLASMISAFIGCSLNGTDIPTLNSLYPTLFEEQKVDNKVDNSWLLVKEMMLDFAQEANKRRKGGNK